MPERSCQQCAAKLPEQARFCPQCGTAVAARIPAGERRQAVVLFADLAGFVTLSRQLDAEDLHRFLSRYFEVIDNTVRQFGGNVDKHIGDAVMAVFGAPLSHGNDAERAVRAALAMHGAIAALAADIGKAIAIHIGIAAGSMVAAATGSDAHREYTVTGEAANLAARLIGHARGGETAIDERVFRACEALVDSSGPHQATLKGFETPVSFWRVTAVRATAPSDYPLVDRTAEMQTIDAAIAAAHSGGRGLAILIRGEPGIGKTRFIDEAIRHAAANGLRTIKTLIVDFGAGRGADVPSTLLRAATDDLAAIRSVPLRAIAGLPLDRSQVAEWDASDAPTRLRRQQEDLAAFLASQSRLQPLLVAVEDVHWADASARGHLAALTAAAREAPLVLLMSTRPGAIPWSDAAIIDLNPLEERDALALAAIVRPCDHAIARQCVARSDGNPLFLVQLVRNAAEAASDIPDSLQSVIQARVDRLSAEDKAVLQAASALGQRFDLAALREVDAGAQAHCGSLIAAGLIRRDGDALMFVHALVRDAVYATLLRAHRRELHSRAAAWFADRDPALRARHLERADDPGAASAYRDAAASAADRLATAEALELADRGLDLAPQVEDRAALAMLRGDALRELGRTEESAATFRDAVPLAPAGLARGRLLLGEATALRILSRLDEAATALDAAAGELADGDALRERALVSFMRGNLFFARGDAVRCRERHEEALRLAREAGDRETEARALGGLGDAAFAAGRLRTALGHFQRCSALCEERGFGRVGVTVQFMIANCLIFECLPLRALQVADAGLAASIRCGNRMAEMIHHVSRAMVLSDMGRFEAAAEACRAGLDKSRRYGARRYTVVSLSILGHCEHEMGLPLAGDATLAEALREARDSGIAFAGPTVLGRIARYAADRTAVTAALAEGEAILAAGSVGQNYLAFCRDAIDACLRIGDLEAAAHHVDRLDAFNAPEPLPWSDLCLRRGRALLAFDRGERDAALVATLGQIADEAARVPAPWAVAGIARRLERADA